MLHIKLHVGRSIRNFCKLANVNIQGGQDFRATNEEQKSAFTKPPGYAWVENYLQ